MGTIDVEVNKKNWVDLRVPVATKRELSSYDALKWAKKYCRSYITNTAYRVGEEWYYRFYFGNERDLILFQLRWT